jgi:predicted transcriptional regulator
MYQNAITPYSYVTALPKERPMIIPGKAKRIAELAQTLGVGRIEATAISMGDRATGLWLHIQQKALKSIADREATS